MGRLSAAILVFIVMSAVGVPSAAAAPTEAEARADTTQKTARLSDGEIKKLLIAASIAEYDGNCPCPYSRARNGSRCGKRSAYSREGGAAPLCFPEDVSAEMVQRYRDEHAEN